MKTLYISIQKTNPELLRTRHCFVVCGKASLCDSHSSVNYKKAHFIQISNLQALLKHNVLILPASFANDSSQIYTEKKKKKKNIMFTKPKAYFVFN